MRLAALQSWFGKEKELPATLRRIREFATRTKDAATAERAARACSFYRAMSLFRQGNRDEARRLAVAAARPMRPLPDPRNPLADGADHDHLILWLAYREAKAVIGFDEAVAQEKTRVEAMESLALVTRATLAATCISGPWPAYFLAVPFRG